MSRRARARGRSSWPELGASATEAVPVRSPPPGSFHGRGEARRSRPTLGVRTWCSLLPTPSPPVPCQGHRPPSPSPSPQAPSAAPPPAGIRARHGGVVAVPAGPALQRPPASLASASAAVADIPARGRMPRRVPPVCLDRPRAWGARQLRLRRRTASPASQALPALATRATPADIGLTTACHARL